MYVNPLAATYLPEGTSYFELNATGAHFFLHGEVCQLLICIYFAYL